MGGRRSRLPWEVFVQERNYHHYPLIIYSIYSKVIFLHDGGHFLLQRGQIDLVMQALETRQAQALIFPTRISQAGWVKRPVRNSFANPSFLKIYHDLLLYHKAFPVNEEIYKLASTEMERIEKSIPGLISNETKKHSLAGSGIAHTEIICSYSRPITAWLIKKFGPAVELDCGDATDEEIINIFQLMVPAVEFEAATQDLLNLNARITRITGKTNRHEQLAWLLKLFEEADLPSILKDELFLQLKIFISWKLDCLSMSRGRLHIAAPTVFYQEKIMHAPDPGKILNQKTGIPVTLSRSEKVSLLECMKASLALYCRETDPISYGDVNELELFEMGRGLSIALTGMKKEKRLSLESYVGYMAFKNGIPVAYGGGWIWGKRCRIGISIYPPFRKAESAWLFCQVLRLYHHYFNAGHFVIRPNQFGKENRDGLMTGAFWFYYKLGFRPAMKNLRLLAAEEWKKISRDKKYRTPVSILRSFTACPMEWWPEKKSFPAVDATELSRQITEYINHHFGGSRATAIKELDAAGSPVDENWKLVCPVLPGYASWSPEQKTLFARFMRMKTRGKEREHILGMQSCHAFWNAVKLLFQQPA